MLGRQLSTYDCSFKTHLDPGINCFSDRAKRGKNQANWTYKHASTTYSICWAFLMFPALTNIWRYIGICLSGYNTLIRKSSLRARYRSEYVWFLASVFLDITKSSQTIFSRTIFNTILGHRLIGLDQLFFPQSLILISFRRPSYNLTYQWPVRTVLPWRHVPFFTINKSTNNWKYPSNKLDCFNNQQHNLTGHYLTITKQIPPYPITNVSISIKDTLKYKTPSAFKGQMNTWFYHQYIWQRFMQVV